MVQTEPEIFLVSACLTGLCTRYDGLSRPSAACMERLAGHCWIPVCPEQLGGLPTPRTPADLVGGDGADVLVGNARVIDRQGRDVTEVFVHGARQCLEIARAQGVTTALLKSGSPSCGLTPRRGVAAALLAAHHITVHEF
ncbi:MAG: DUF523 domain-containing protein [Desulfobulbaceae bacterium]